MRYLLIFLCFMVLGLSNLVANAQPTAREDGKPEEVNSTIEILDVAKAENGWTGVRDNNARDGGWTGALKTFPPSQELIEVRLLFAPTGKRPEWWGQLDIGRHPFLGLPQTNVLNPTIQASETGNLKDGLQDFATQDFNPPNFVSLPVLQANVRGPVWDESLGLYTATLFIAPKPQDDVLWPKQYRYLRFSGQLPDLFGKLESRNEIPFEIDFSTQKFGDTERWGARLRGRDAHFFLKSVRVQARNPQSYDKEFGRAATQYEVITTLVGVYPTETFTYFVDSPAHFNGEGKAATVPAQVAISDHVTATPRPEPNIPFFVPRRVAFGLDPQAGKESNSLFFRSHLGWPNSPNVLYPVRVDGKVPIGEVAPNQWRFELPTAQ